MARRLKQTDLPNLLRCEISIGPPRADMGLTGSGLILVNPPFQLDAELKILLPALGRAFGPQSASRIDWLTAER